MKVMLVGLSATLALVLCAACGGVEDKVAPSMVNIRFKDLNLGGGTGFLVKGNYIVAAAHVVWPYATLDVTLNDGTPYSDVPIIAYDHLADLAFLGPIDTSAPHLEFADAKNESTGNKTFTVGYANWTPQLSFNEGTFEYVSIANPEIEAVSSSARAIGGMSGGPMVNENGEVIGALVRSYETGSGRSMGPTSNTIRDRLNKIAGGEDVSQLGSRGPSTLEGSTKHQFVLRGRWDTVVFTSDSSSASIQFDMPVDVEYGFFDSRLGVEAAISEDGVTELRPDLRRAGLGNAKECCPPDDPWFLVVKQGYDFERAVELTSSVPLARYHDPDDGRHIEPGDTVTGVFDTSVDVDWYTIDLEAGARIEIRATHALFVNAVRATFDHPAMPPHEITVRRGTAGRDVFRAPVDGTYDIAIWRVTDSRRSYRGYSLEIAGLFGNP